MGNCCCHIPESREDDYISMSHDEQEQEYEREQERTSLIKNVHSPQPNTLSIEEEEICSPSTPYLTASDLSSASQQSFTCPSSSETNSEGSDENETFYSLPNSYREMPSGILHESNEQMTEADEDPLENIEIPDPTPEPAFLPSPVSETRGKKKKKKHQNHHNHNHNQE